MRWEHRVSARGATLTLTTADGRVLRGADVGAALNRLASPPLAVLGAAELGDREYARNELTAFAASWLGSLSTTVINRPSPHGLCGRWRQPLEWRALAARAGMNCVPLLLSSADPDAGLQPPGTGDGPSVTILAVDGRLLYAGVPAALQRACERLTRLCATRVLGLRFDSADPARGGWRFLDATPYPDLAFAGEAGVAALEAALAT